MISVLFLSKILIIAFVGSVTCWYFFTPYLVQPHESIVSDLMQRSSLTLQPPSSPKPDDQDPTEFRIENWTKWRLYLRTDDLPPVQVIYKSSAKLIFFQSKAVMQMEWRPEYDIIVEISSANTISARISAPALSCHKWGIYNHLDVIVEGNTVKIVPRFLFGIPFETVELIYGHSTEDILQRLPIIGVYFDTNFLDRLLIQCYMVIVTMSIVFLLVANNPPSSFVQAASSKVLVDDDDNANTNASNSVQKRLVS